MNVSKFVACWKSDKDRLVSEYLGTMGHSEVAVKIASLNLTADQLVVMRKVVDGILTDAYYGLLLGLDGAASIGDIQQPYLLYDENGKLISEPGDIEAEAWEQFHGDP